ncbi:MAG TPA: serine/threonine-protein kinase, partial [Candidatus Acidoferrales bacterium]
MIGEKLGPYRVLERIGEGGMGVVYRAHDERLDRDVALKVLPARFVPDEAARERLFREARTASALNHPNICTIHEIAEAGGHPYIAMEFIEGRRLVDLIPDEGLSTDQVVRYGEQIADALEHAHRRGVVHRDLKSANVMITPESRVKVLDFGLAVRTTGPLADVTRSSDSLAKSGMVAGTLPYLAPEVLRGAQADARSDIWSLGIILCETATGQLPFHGGTGYELSSSILRDSLPPMPAHLPPHLAVVIQHCLMKDPAQRYQNAGEVRAALETIQPGSAVVPRELLVPPQRMSRRAWLGLVAAAALAGIAALIGLNVGGLRHRLFPAGAVRSIAVAPFEDLSGEPEKAYFAAGMTEAITTELSRFAGLQVVSLRDVGSGAVAPIELARQTGVDAMLRGSVLRAGNRVRINVQLIETRGARTLWAQSYDRALRDVLS